MSEAAALTARNPLVQCRVAGHLIYNDVGDIRQLQVAPQAPQQDAGGAEQQPCGARHGSIQAHMVPHPGACSKGRCLSAAAQLSLGQLLHPSSYSLPESTQPSVLRQLLCPRWLCLSHERDWHGILAWLLLASLHATSAAASGMKACWF